MKYYNDLQIDRSRTINKYEVKDDKIIITYLDNKKYEIAYTKENERQVQLEMIDQAKKVFRYAFSDYDKYNNNIENIGNITQASTYALANAFSGACAAFEASQPTSASQIGITLFSMCCWIYFFGKSVKFVSDNDFKINVKNKRDKAIEKYNLYFDNMNILEKYKNDSNLYKGTNVKKIDINTLDKCSLKKLRKIINNGRSYEGYLNKSEEIHKKFEKERTKELKIENY